MTSEQIATWARERGLPIDAARAALFEVGLTSLLSRAQRLGDLLPRETAPPPNRAPR